MWPVIERGAPPAASSMPYLVSSSLISSSVSQMGISMATVLEFVREHEILQRLVPQLVVADSRDDEAGSCGRRVLFAVDDDAVGIRKRGRACEARAFGSSSRRKSSCGHVDGNVFEKSCERFEALMLRIAPQKRELRAMIRVGVDLAVIELDRADGLLGRIDRRRFGAQAAEGRVLFVRADPCRDRGRGDSAAGFRFEALGGLVERVAEVVERERLQHQADRVGLVAQRGRARREGALA